MNTSLPDEQLLFEKLSRYLQDIPGRCPYGLPHTAVYQVIRLKEIPQELMGVMLAKGFRRNGDTLYNMQCPGCKKCIPIRIKPEKFIPNRSQKRTAKKNCDLSIEFHEPEPTREKTYLLQNFFLARFPEHPKSATDFYRDFFNTSSNFSQEIHYRLGNKLVGVAITDIGTNWLNAVYFFFDPGISARGPGTFNILNLIRVCREKHIGYLYLGYWIDEVRAMRYKSAFTPNQLYIDNGWQTVG